jgi:predicted permease
LLQLIEIFINVVMPVFTLVLIGYYAGPKLKLEARPLSRFAYFVLVPAFTFNIISTAQVQAVLAVRMIIYIVVVYTSSALLGLLIAWLLGRPAKMIGAYVLLAVFGNVGNFGLPLIEFRLGKEALLAATLYFLAASTLAFAIGVAAANWNSGKKLAALSEVAKTPALLAMLPAFFFNWAEIEPPLFLARVINLLAAAMIPIMLIVLGVQLASVGRPRFSRDVWVASAIRLVGGPILGFFWVIPFGLTGIERGAGIFQAAMPAAVLASIIALEYDLLPDFVTTAVLFSTLASIVTLTIVLAMV